MHYFNVPADFQKETIDTYAEMNRQYPHAKVLTTYGNITKGQSILSSGRAVENLPELDMEGLADYIRYSDEQGIGFEYTLNSTTMNNREFSPEGITQLKQFFHKIYDAGVRTVIVALPPLFEIIRATGLGFDIKASVLCQITSANKALKYQEMGADKIVPDESVSRDFGTLKRIRRVFGEHVELIVNTVCNKDCHYRMFHYNQMSADNNLSSDGISNTFYPNRCILQFYHDFTSTLRSCWIRPEDLKHYSAIGINHFKLQGRHTICLKLEGDRPPSRGNIVQVVDAYFREDYDGDLNDLIYCFNPAFKTFRVPIPNKKLEGFLKPFTEHERFCARDCATCHYCEGFATRVIDKEQQRLVKEKMEMFFGAFDKFGNVIREKHGIRPL